MSIALPTPNMTVPKSRVWPAQYEMLNGWRGAAAIAVVLNHVKEIPAGHVAVMLFFVISGYCITAASESCLQKGLSFRQFMWRRIRRIYPPYLLSLIFFIITRLIKFRFSGENDLARPFEQWVQNFTLTQWLTLIAHPTSYAFENPTLFVNAYWSLNYEEQFYIVIGLLMIPAIKYKFDIRWPIVVLVACALVWNVIFPHISYGIFIEYWVHFGLGAVLFYRLCRPMTIWLSRGIDGSFALMAAVCFWLARPNLIRPDTRFVAQELFVVSVFALLLIFLRPLDDTFKKLPLSKPFLWLGTITYSLYLIHQFNLNLIASIAGRIVPSSFPEWISVIVQVALHVVLAIPFWFLCERPFLNKKIPQNPNVSMS